MPCMPKSHLTNPVKLMTKIVISPVVHIADHSRKGCFPVSSGRKIGDGGSKALLIMAAIVALLWMASPAAADVVVFDQITTVNQSVFIKIMTKGRFFPAGGQRIALRIDSGQPRQLLSGGDGYAYYKFTPVKSGTFQIEAVSGDNRSSGIILVVRPPEKVLVIDAEGGLRAAALSEQSRSESLDALKQLSRRFRLIYLTRWVGPQMLKKWLAEKKFPSAVVLKWKDSDFFERLRQRKISIAAVIGSDSLLEASREHVERRYSFNETSHGTLVKDWSEIIKLLTGRNQTE